MEIVEHHMEVSQQQIMEKNLRKNIHGGKLANLKGQIPFMIDHLLDQTPIAVKNQRLSGQKTNR